MDIDPKDTLAIIAAYPDGLIDPRILAWLSRHGIPMAQIAVHNVRGYVCAFNRAIRDIALPSRFGQFIFCDRDMMPSLATDPFLDAQADVVGARFPLSNEDTWSEPTRIHTGLWRCHRRVLETVQPPWFLEEYSSDGCDIVQCVCEHFRHKVLAAGFAIVRAGWCDHKVT